MCIRDSPNTWVFRELARRMGFTEPCFSEDDETIAAQAFNMDNPVNLSLIHI